jgi:hypothetical protein
MHSSQSENINTSLENPALVISDEAGFSPLSTESVSSKVFLKDGHVYKLTSRNSVERLSADVRMLMERLSKYPGHIPPSTVGTANYLNEPYTYVCQAVVDGAVLKSLDPAVLEAALRSNKDFLLELLAYFFESIEAKQLYPDPIGYPKDPDYTNSINLMLEKGTGKVILCDVGLSPHEDTLRNYGIGFFDEENVATYVAKMQKFEEVLRAL